MSSTKSGINLHCAFLSLLNFLLKKPNQQKQTYDYTQCVYGRDYVFEPVEGDFSKGYMTSQRKGVKRGDLIILQNGSSSYVYQVEDIDYYLDPPDMWMALLVTSDC
jgi:hypothetical protein